MTLCGLFVLPIPIFQTGRRAVDSAGSGKDTSVPFPCMMKSCGCRNAEDCWRGCCCFANTQKLAWARKNAVEVPAYVVDAARRESQTPDSSDDPGSWWSLLANFLTPASSAVGGECCDKSSAASSPQGACCTVPATGSRNISLQLVSTVKALQCRGLSLTLALASTLMVATGPQMELSDERPGFRLVITSETLPEATLCPPVPPPRLRGV